MPEEKKYRNYSAADIEKYHSGLLAPAEMHAMERAALDDPFLADALEGYGKKGLNVTADLSDLQQRLEKKIATAQVVTIPVTRRRFAGWKVAAALIIVGGLGFLTYRISRNIGNGATIARLPQKKSADSVQSGIVDARAIDSDKTVPPESGTVATGPKPGRESTGRSFNRAKVDSAISTINSSNEEMATATRAPVTLDHTKQKTDSTNGKQPSPAYPAALAKTKKVAEENKPLRGLVASGDDISASGQQKMNYFRGHVVDVNNNALPFANITSTRSNVGTYADAQGNFTLIAPDSALEVQVRSVGFENNSVQLKSNAANKVILQDDQAVADRVISYKNFDTARSRTGSFRSEEPEPADGWTNYDTYLTNNVQIPDDLRSGVNRGQVRLSFEVTAQGKPVNFKIERSLCQKCDQEAIRLVQQGPKWKKQTRKIRRVTLTVPFDADR